MSKEIPVEHEPTPTPAPTLAERRLGRSRGQRTAAPEEVYAGASPSSGRLSGNGASNSLPPTHVEKKLNPNLKRVIE
ncbi:MAG: hypothetical protein AAGJ31_04280 [Verrucomicrobiota bacterium]